jgi:MFS family permease
LRANWQQFALLVAVNAFVGAMVGLERSTLPLLAEEEFGITSKVAAVSFIATFGLAKALTNLFAGEIAGQLPRKKLLVGGWLVGLLVPFILIWGPGWNWIVGANLLLGINQGLTWSMTVNMKVDLVGPRHRGLALGLNEAVGYMSVAGAAYLSGIIASHYGLRPEPFYLGIGFAAIGLALSTFFVQDTSRFVALEASHRPVESRISLSKMFAEVSWRQRRLWGVTQAGFVNNLNDGLIWGIFPLFFGSKGLSIERIALLAATYPLVWGSLQVITGWLSDITGRKPMIVFGMLIQGFAIWLAIASDSFVVWMVAVGLVGLGTAMVYPTLLASIGDAVHPEMRSSALGVYRFWRDAGAIAGALLGGTLADSLGFSTAVQVVAALTIISGLLAGMTLKDDWTARPQKMGVTP